MVNTNSNQIPAMYRQHKVSPYVMLTQSRILTTQQKSYYRFKGTIIM